MEQIVINMTLVIGIVGIFAFAVSIITQVFKGVSGLKKIPTDILVFVLSIGLTVTAFIAYMQYIHDSSSNSSRPISSFCGNVRLGKSSRIVETILQSE